MSFLRNFPGCLDPVTLHDANRLQITAHVYAAAKWFKENGDMIAYNDRKQFMRWIRDKKPATPKIRKAYQKRHGVHSTNRLHITQTELDFADAFLNERAPIDI